MKANCRANYERFGPFFAGGLKKISFDRNGCIGLCVVSFFNQCFPLNCMQLLKGLKTERYNTASRIRNHCAAILQVNEVDLMSPELRKSKFREKIGWVDNGNGVGSYSTVDVEILHKNYSGEYNLASIFLNPILMGVSTRCIIKTPNTHCLFG